MWTIRATVMCVGLLIASAIRADVRVYDVDFKYQREVYEALSQLLIADPTSAVPGSAYGRVQLLPTGQILVDAAPATHGQIEELLAAVRARQAEVPPSARFRYWVVLGSQAADVDAGDVPSALSDVLAELERVHGDLTFKVLGTATLVTESGQVGSVDGRPLRISQRAYVQGETASAWMQVGLAIRERVIFGAASPNATVNTFNTEQERETQQELNLNVTLRRGEFLVLGENTLQTPGGLEGTLFYIVHWPAE